MIEQERNEMMHKIHVFGGGTFSHVRNHMALAAPAFGETAKYLHKELLYHRFDEFSRDRSMTLTMSEVEDSVQLHLTKMAYSESPLVTNEDISARLDGLLTDPQTKVIIFNAALCDFNGSILDTNENGFVTETPSGKYETRLKTSAGGQLMGIYPADKVIGNIKTTRPDVFVIGFKTTCGAESKEQYDLALKQITDSNVNLVLANDTKTRNNMLVSSDGICYGESQDRTAILNMLIAEINSLQF